MDALNQPKKPVDNDLERSLQLQEFMLNAYLKAISKSEVQRSVPH